MYKLLFADDEEEVRKGVLQKIDFSTFGFTVIEEAENGAEALEIAEKMEPDILITDIKMPFMDGLELAEQLREHSPMTKVVILTGFEDFEYARKAIQLNIIDYVLKPVSKVDFEEILKRTKALLDEERIQNDDIKQLRSHYVDSLPILREKFMATLLHHDIDERRVVEKFSAYGIDLLGSLYSVAVVRIDGKNDMEKEAVELLYIALLDLANRVIGESVSNQLKFFPFLLDERLIIVFSADELSEEQYLSKVYSCLDLMRMTADKNLRETVTIGLGMVQHRVVDLHNGYNGAVQALNYRFVIGRGRVIYIGDVEPTVEKIDLFSEQREVKLISAIKVGRVEEVDSLLNDIMNDIVTYKLSQDVYSLNLLEMVTAIVKTAKNLNVQLPVVAMNHQNLYTEFFKISSLEAVIAWLREMCLSLTTGISENRSHSNRKTVEIAKAYAEEHFCEQDLSINAVCTALHLSPAYFSNMFKKEAKTTFMSYVQQLRMEKAKDLLASTDLKAFEISEQVGYSEPNYFSYCYKKYYGCSPKEFRASLNG